MTCQAWTGTDRVLVRDNYQTKGAVWCSQNTKIKHTPGAVNEFARVNGFARTEAERRKPSTPAIDAHLRLAHARTQGRNFVGQAAHDLGLSKGWVYRRVATLGLTVGKRESKPYSDAEKQFIIAHAHLSRQHIARLMRRKGWNRSPAGLQKYIEYHRIGDNGEYQGGRALALCLGVDKATIWSWSRSGLLIAADRNGRSEGDAEPLRRVYHEVEVARFIVQNPGLIDVRKVDGPWFIDLLARHGSTGLGDSRDQGKRIAAIKAENPDCTPVQIAAMVGTTRDVVSVTLSRQKRREAQRAA